MKDGSGDRHSTMRIENRHHLVLSVHLLIWHMSGCSFLCVLPDFLLRPSVGDGDKDSRMVSVCACCFNSGQRDIDWSANCSTNNQMGRVEKMFLVRRSSNVYSVIILLLQVEVKQLETDIDNLRGACNQMSEKVTHLTAGKGEWQKIICSWHKPKWKVVVVHCAMCTVRTWHGENRFSTHIYLGTLLKVSRLKRKGLWKD